MKNSDASFADSLKGLTKTPIVLDEHWKKLIKIGVADYFRGHTVMVRRVRTVPLPALPVNGEGGVRSGEGGVRSGEGGLKIRTKIELKPLRNRQWSSASFFSMGGIRTSLSGQFARSRKAYFAIFPDGAAAPAFISLDDLIDGDAGILVNRVEYRMTLSPNLFDRLGSKILVKRAADGTQNEVTMRRILDKVFLNGAAISAGGKAFRMFYGQDVDDRGEQPQEGKEESLAFLLAEGPDYTTFLIPLETVPTDGTAGEFQLRPGLNLTLRLKGGVLEAY